MQRRVLLLLIVLMCVPATAQAVVTISTGSYIFAPGTTGNPISVTMTPGAGEVWTDGNLRLGINGGIGPAPGVETLFTVATPGAGGVAFAGAELIGSAWDTFGIGGSGGVAGAPNGTLPGSAGLETIGGFAVTSLANPASAAGVYAAMTISTVGVPAGVYPLLLVNGAGSTDLFNSPGGVPSAVAVSLVGGTITVIPEPSSILLGLFAAAGLGAVAIRRHRRKVA